MTIRNEVGPANPLLGRVWSDPAVLRHAAQRATSADPASPAAAPRSAGLWATGIKVIDVFAPLRMGGITSLCSGPAIGKFALVSELAYLVGQDGGAAVMVASGSPGENILVDILRKNQVDHLVAALIGPADRAAELLDAGLHAVDALAAGGRPVLLFLETSLVTPAAVATLRQRHAARPQPLITIVVNYDNVEPPAWLAAELDGSIVLSSALAHANIWPAIDPVASWSAALETADEAHRQAASAARSLLADAGEEAQAPRAALLRQFQTQPFFIAAPYNGMAGVRVDLAVSVAGFAALAAGTHDDADPATLAYIGALT